VESPYSLTGLLEQPALPQPVPAQAMRQAMQEAAPLESLPPLPSIPDADLLTPGSPEYDHYLPAFNLRTAVRPALRALCKTEVAVAAMVNWVRDQNVPFAIRCGGHSFEGFSQSPQVVIDVRGIEAVAVDLAGQTVMHLAGAQINIVATDVWRDALLRDGVLDKDDSEVRKRFWDLKNRLAAKNVIGERDGCVWIADLP